MKGSIELQKGFVLLSCKFFLENCNAAQYGKQPIGIFCSIFRPVSLVKALESLLGFRPEKRASKFSDSSTVDMELSCDPRVFHISNHSFEQAEMAGDSQTDESCVQTNCCFYLYDFLFHLCSFTGCQDYVISNLFACVFCAH